MKTAVSVESSADLTKELTEKYGITVIPYQISIGDDSFKDGEKLPEELFDAVDKTGVLPKTAALNRFEYEQFFKSLKKDCDAVIHFCLSGGITSSCENARQAAASVGGVFVIDSFSLSMGTGLMAITARELLQSGKSPEETVAALSETVPKVVTAFVIERLDYLYKGGRCNSLQLLGANVLKIRPRIILKNGKMVSDKKYRGNMSAVTAKFAEELTAEFPPASNRGYITYTTATPEMLQAALSKCAEAGMNDVTVTRAGATISSHCGANTLGIFYVAK